MPSPLIWRAARPAATPRPAAEPPAPAPPPRPLNILVADDNRTNQLIVSLLLKRAGHAVEVADTGIVAVAAAASGAFDVILMDIQMPDMDGVTAMRAIRAMPSAAGDVPIVALTASARAGDRESYLSAGMTDYVTKPIEAGTLLAAVARAAGAGAGSRRRVGSAA